LLRYALDWTRTLSGPTTFALQTFALFSIFQQIWAFLRSISGDSSAPVRQRSKVQMISANPAGPHDATKYGLPPDPQFDPTSVMKKRALSLAHPRHRLSQQCQPLIACLSASCKWSLSHPLHLPNQRRFEQMPAFGPSGDREMEVWQIIAYLRHLPTLTPEEEQKIFACAR